MTDDNTPDAPEFETRTYTGSDPEDGTPIDYTFEADAESGKIHWSAEWNDRKQTGYTDEISDKHGAIIYPNNPRINGEKTRGTKLDDELLDALKDDLAAAQDYAKAARAKRREAPLTYEVTEYTKTSRAGGWGKREVTKQRLTPSKSMGDMDERERELHRRVDTDRVPDDAEPGDELTFEDLLDDPRTTDEREQDALDEAAESDEEVVVWRDTARCNDSREECNLDHVTRVATPDGEIETRRTHTW